MISPIFEIKFVISWIVNIWCVLFIRNLLIKMGNKDWKNPIKSKKFIISWIVNEYSVLFIKNYFLKMGIESKKSPT